MSDEGNKDDVEKIVTEYFSNLTKQHVYEGQQHVYHHFDKSIAEKIPAIKERKDTLLKELKVQMKKELSVGINQ